MAEESPETVPQREYASSLNGEGKTNDQKELDKYKIRLKRLRKKQHKNVADQQMEKDLTTAIKLLESLKVVDDGIKTLNGVTKEMPNSKSTRKTNKSMLDWFLNLFK